MAQYSPVTFNIAILNTDDSVPDVKAKRGSYGTIFHQALQSAASRTAPHIKIQSTEFDVVNGRFPPTRSSYLTKLDAILVSGSIHTVYKSTGSDWIARLDNFLGHVYTKHPHIRLFGSCFGHQIISYSILRRLGVDVAVEKNPAGWELGPHPITLTEDFQRAAQPLFARRGRQLPEQLKIQLVHGDHVTLPVCPATDRPELPPSWSLVGSTSQCMVQGLHQQGRVLTFQGHFEFDRWVNAKTIEFFGAHWGDERLVAEGVQAALKGEDDSLFLAELVLSFLVEGRDVTVGTVTSKVNIPVIEHIEQQAHVSGSFAWVPWRYFGRLLGWVDILMSRTTTW